MRLFFTLQNPQNNIYGTVLHTIIENSQIFLKWGLIDKKGFKKVKV